MFKRFLHFALLSAIVLSMLAITPASTARAASTRVVTKTADTNDGTCDADCSLREAVAAAGDGDTIDASGIHGDSKVA